MRSADDGGPDNERGSARARLPDPRRARDDRLDLRLVPAALGAWLAVLAAPALGVRLTTAGAAGCVVAAVLVAARWPSRWAPALVAALACTAAGGLGAAARGVAVGEGPLSALARERATATVGLVVLGDPHRVLPKRSGPDAPQRAVFVVPARAEDVTARGRSTDIRSPIVVFAEDERWLALLPGTRVIASGRLAASRDTADAALLLARGPPDVTNDAGALQRVAGRLRASLRRAVRPLPSAERGLVPGLVVGDTADMPAALAGDFRTAGLTHLVAVSGANLAITGGAVLTVVLRLGFGRRIAAVAAGLAMVGFIILARPEPSVLRAGAMGTVALIALSTGRRRAAIPALAAAVLVLLFVDPGLGRSYGFALSALATGGIVVFASPWAKLLQARGVPGPLAAAVAVPAAAQVACGPVIAMLSSSVSLVAIPANLLVAPAVAPATLLGVGAAATGPISPVIAGVLGRLTWLPAAWIVTVAQRSADLPHAALGWPGGTGGALLLTVVTVGAALLLRSLNKRPPRYRRRWAAAAGVIVLLASLLQAVRPDHWPPPGWVLVACDVGQGDGLVLSVAAHTAVVVDSGPDPEVMDRCLRRLAVTRVPLVVLTHLHADHVGGLVGVLRRREVGEVEIGPLDEPEGDGRDVARWTAGAALRVTRVVDGEARGVGGVSWQVLWPARVIRGQGSDPNNASIVMLVDTHGVRLLLTGDVERAAAEELRPVLDRVLGGRPIDVLKVPHHGSASQSPGLLTGVRARVGIVSVGAANPYGHPAAPTLALLAAAGTRVWRTDLAGDVAVVGSGDALRVVSRGR